MESLTQKLISCVKDHPILYDLSNGDYRNVKKKDQIWDEIGVELNESGDELKKKWKNLRDCYAKYIRSEKAETGPARYYKTWPWAKQMDAFKPFLKFAHNVNKDLIDLNENSECTSHNAETNEDSYESQEQDNTLPPKKVKCETIQSENTVNKIMEYHKKKRKKSGGHSSDISATEHMFLGFAKTIETFSPRRQAVVKLRIANIVLEEELLQANSEEYVL